MTVHHLPLPSGARIPDREDREWVTSSELMDAVGISHRQVDYWTRTGLLIPLEAASPGSGYLRRYDEHQVARAVVIHDLLLAGIALVIIREVVDQVLTDGYADIGACTITHHPTGEAS